MGAGSLIAAHKNDFNKSILKENGFYFQNKEDVRDLMDFAKKSDNLSRIEANRIAVKEHFNWSKINSAYEELFINALDLKWTE